MSTLHAGSSVQLSPGYVHFALTSPTTLTYVSLHFRTLSAHAPLVHLGSLGSLEVVHGSVVFRRSHDSELMLTGLTLAADSYVNDGQWHQVTVTMTTSNTKVSIARQRMYIRHPRVTERRVTPKIIMLALSRVVYRGTPIKNGY